MAAARFFALAAALSVASSPLAAEVGVLPVGPPPGPSPELVDLTNELRPLVAARTPGVLGPDLLRERMVAVRGNEGSPSTALADLDRAYDAARKAALADDFEGATRRLQAVVEALEKLPDGDETMRQWTRAMLRLAKTDLDFGRTDEARKVLLRLVRVAPDVAVDPRAYPPRFERLVADAKKEVQSEPTARLRVTSPQVGAHVWVDGRDVGAVPVALGLVRARHRVSLVQGARRVGPLLVDLSKGDQALALDLGAPEAFRPNLGPGLALADEERGALVPAAALLGLDTLISTSLVLQGGARYLVGTLWDVHHGAPVRQARARLAETVLPPGAGDALAEYLLTGQTASRLIDVPGREPDLTVAEPNADQKTAADLKTPAPREQKSKALGWVAFTTGVATVGLAGFSVWQGLAAKSAYNDANAVRDIDPAKYNAKLADGDSAKKNATIGGIAAGACGVATIVLGWIAIKQTGEMGPLHF